LLCTKTRAAGQATRCRTLGRFNDEHPDVSAMRGMARTLWGDARMTNNILDQSATYDHFIEVVRRRRSVRRFTKGREVSRDTLLKIAEAARWAPTGANAQCWDLIVIDDKKAKQNVLDVFLRQSQRLVNHAEGFPAVKKTYLANTVAILVVLGDPRFKVCFPQGTTSDWQQEYSDNNERIFVASLGAVIQNIQLAVAACGLTSAWLSGGGEDTTNKELAAVLEYPPHLVAIGTVPIGFPEKDVSLRYRRPLDHIVHWNHFDKSKLRPDIMIDHYVKEVRPFAMYRGLENVHDWEDADEILGEYKRFY
jgi:nitroreductase